MMLRKLVGVTAAFGMLVGLASTATAADFYPLKSQMTFNLGALPTVEIPATYGTSDDTSAELTGAATGTFSHGLTGDASIFVGAGLAIPTTLLTGVAALSQLTITANNSAANFTSTFSTANPIAGSAVTTTPQSGTMCPGGCLGGPNLVNGQFILNGALVVPLTNGVGGGAGVGGTIPAPLGIVATAAPFVTAKVRMTNLSTNVIQVFGRPGGPQTGVGLTIAPAGTEMTRTFTVNGGFRTDNLAATLETRATITVGGSNILGSTAVGGSVTLVAPIRIDTGPTLAAGVIGAMIKQTFFFVPEPGTALLLVSGAAGLIFIGRRKMKN